MIISGDFVRLESRSLKPAVIVALGTGMRLGEQLRMKRSQVDFFAELCKDKRPDAYVFVSPKDDDERQREVKKGFHTACRLAGIEGLI